MTTSAYRLILHPHDPHALPDREALLATLRTSGFLGEPWSGGEGRFLVGERFFHHVTFLGCSPHVEVEPPADGGRGFTHIELSPPLAIPRLFSGEVGSPPRCRRCRHSLEVVPGEALLVTCPGCGAALDLEGIDWRHAAGGGRLLLSIWGIHPHEAVPSDLLLGLVSRGQREGWDYFYSRF